MPGHRDVTNASQRNDEKWSRKSRRVVGLTLLSMVLSVMFGSAAPRQVFATSQACANNPTVTTSSTAPAQRTSTYSSQAPTSQSACSTGQSTAHRVPAQPATATPVPISQVPAQPAPRDLGRRADPVPTPPPATPTPVPVEPTPAPTQPAQQQPAPSGSIEGMIDEIFGPYAAGAKNVARCESGMNPNATNPVSIGGSNAAGLFQILYPSTWNTTSQAALSPYDARANIIAAHEIFVRSGYSWSQWTCQP